MKTKYVVGFMFDDSLQRVALIRKTKPEWQKGLLNGIGGKVENDEHTLSAMEREFLEETGQTTRGIGWRSYATMTDRITWEVSCLACVGQIDLLRTMEAEEVVIIAVNEIRLVDNRMIENLPWLIAMAIDCLQDKRPEFSFVTYPVS